jgi:hypothetical protein
MHEILRSAQDDNLRVLSRSRLQLLDQRRDRADVLHLLDIFGLELHSDLFFDGENQIQMLYGIPILDVSGEDAAVILCAGIPKISLATFRTCSNVLAVNSFLPVSFRRLTQELLSA